MLDNYADSAKTFTFAAILVEGIFTVLFVVYFGLALGFIANIQPTNPPATGTPFNFNFGFMVMGIMAVVFGIIGLLWVLLDYFLIYKKIIGEDIRGAQDTAVILGIIQLVLGGIIPGVLIIVAYTQLNNSVNRNLYAPQGQN